MRFEPVNFSQLFHRCGIPTVFRQALSCPMQNTREYITEEEVQKTLWLYLKGRDELYPCRGISGNHYALAASLHVEKLGLHGSCFISYLPSFSGLSRFSVGSDGAYTVYWMIDAERRIRNAMMVLYDGAYRIRTFLRYRTKGTGYSTCLFGLNQEYVTPLFRDVSSNVPPIGLTDDPDVAIRQSRETPELLWLSTCWMYPTERLLHPLYKRDILLVFSEKDMMKRTSYLLRANKCSTHEIYTNDYEENQ